MITFEEALKTVLENTPVLGPQRMAIEGSVGMVLREDVVSALDMPPFDKAAVDGYAVRAVDVSSVPSLLKCIGCVEAGNSFIREIKSGLCVKIMTGAPLPAGADCVVMVEDTRICGKHIKILRSVKKGENMCMRGEDLKKRQVVLKEGAVLSSSHIALLAAVGRGFVQVVKRPSVALVNTGGEIVPVGTRRSRVQIYNSNGPLLSALLRSDGIEYSFLGIAKDEPLPLKKAIEKGLGSRILLISGGVSMGDYDLVPETLKTLGVKKIFHNVRMKPGKPLFFGLKNQTLVFGIPGNPVSNFLSYLVFVRPAIRKMMGYHIYRPEFRNGVVRSSYHQRSGRRHFVVARISKKNNSYHLWPLNAHGSADILSLSRADGFMMVGDEEQVVEAGVTMPFVTWKTL